MLPLALVPFVLVRRTAAPHPRLVGWGLAGVALALVAAWLIKGRKARRDPWRRLSRRELEALIAEARTVRRGPAQRDRR